MKTISQILEELVADFVSNKGCKPKDMKDCLNAKSCPCDSGYKAKALAEIKQAVLLCLPTRDDHDMETVREIEKLFGEGK